MRTAVTFAAILAVGGSAAASAPPGVGKEEFGLTTRQLVQKVERVEASIARCMRGQGFEYVAVDYKTVRRGMSAAKNIPGLSEEEFTDKYGFGLSTLYTGEPPQLQSERLPHQQRFSHLQRRLTALAPGNRAPLDHFNA